MKKWIKWVTLFSAAALIAAGFGLTDSRAGQQAEADTIADHIYVGEVAVGGMSEQDAESAVDSYVDGLSSEMFTLSANGKTLAVSAEELGLTWQNTDVVKEAAEYGKSGNLIARYKVSKDLEVTDQVFPISLQVNETKAEAYLQEHVEELNEEAVDYGLTRENGQFEVTGGIEGVEVNVEKSVEALTEYFAGNWQKHATIDLVAEISEPQGSEEELSKVQDVLGTFTTNYASSASGRKTNIANGCSKINGTVIYPGETFSVYDAVKPFDAENGYALAGAYESGKTVDAYGGGICQVSTTLYNAVIRAELEIVERSGHSMLVSYVDPSADAAIAGETKDFKFKNNLETPIYIEGSSNGATITFTVYGEETRPSNRKVSFESETLSTTEPTVEYEASDDPIGTITKTQSSHTGKTAQLWKIVTVDGVEESREVFNKTTYNMSPTIYSVGTASSSAEATAAMKAAIASQNESTIRAAASEWSASAVAAKQKAEEDAAAQQTQQQQQTTGSGTSTGTSAGTSTGTSTGTDSGDTGDSGTESEPAEAQ